MWLGPSPAAENSVAASGFVAFVTVDKGPRVGPLLLLLKNAC